MQHSILQISSMGSSLTNDEDAARQCCLCMDQSHPAGPCWWQVLPTADVRQAAPSARAWTHKADTAVRCRLVPLMVPSLLWRPPFQNPCRTTTPDNSLKRDGRSENIAYLLYHFCDLWCGNFAHLLPLSYHLSQLRTSPTKCWDY